jgi:hypothetical protein
MEGHTRDLAVFSLAADSKLRGCDVIAVRVDVVAPNGYTLDGDGAPEENGETSSVRNYRVDSAGDRRVPALDWGNLHAGHTKIKSTVRYFGIEIGDVIDAEKIESEVSG